MAALLVSFPRLLMYIIGYSNSSSFGFLISVAKADTNVITKMLSKNPVGLNLNGKCQN
jgi:hypothetical protein